MKLLRCLCIALLAATLLFAFCSCDGTLIEDPAQYGNYAHAYDRKAFEKFTGELLPEKLEDYFENVEYSCLLGQDDVANEVFLRFNITDTDKYYAYKQSVLGENETTPFYYEEGCEQYAIWDQFYEEPSDKYFFISCVRILKVLFCDKTQTVTYIALYSPYTSPVLYPLDFSYFEKFGIDVAEGYHGAFAEHNIYG